MALPPEAMHGEVLAAELRAGLHRLGFAHLSTRYIAERHVLRVSWPHREGGDAREGVEVPASGEWAARALELFGTSRRGEGRAGAAGS